MYSILLVIVATILFVALLLSIFSYVIFGLKHFQFQLQRRAAWNKQVFA